MGCDVEGKYQKRKGKRLKIKKSLYSLANLNKWVSIFENFVIMALSSIH